MEESTLKLAGFTDCMNSVESKIQKTNTAIVQCPNVRRIQFAKENLNKVISQVEFFANVPERVAQKRVLLEENPGRLKDVFLEALELEAWRSALMTEIANSRRSKRLTVTAPPPASPSRNTNSDKNKTSIASHSEGYSDETYSLIQQVVTSHLGIVAELSRDVKNTMWGNIERLFDVAAERPEDLVASFEIIEMHQQYLDRRRAEAEKRTQLSGKGPVDLSSIGYMNLREQAAERLNRNLSQKIEARFIVKLEESSNATDDKSHKRYKSSAAMGADITVPTILSAATEIVQTMVVFRNEVLPCIPPSYEALNICISAFEEQFTPYLKDLTRDVTQLDVSDIVSLVDWIDYFLGQLIVFEMPNRPSSAAYSQISEDLMNEYLDRIKNQVMEWFGNIRRQQTEVVQSTDGTLITSTPEDMFNVIHMQIAVAKDRLAREHLKDPVNACLQVC